MAMRDWSGDATKIFKGKKVVKIRYTNKSESEELGWYQAAPVILFDDGSWILASSDDEGNDGGVLFTSSDDMPTIPSINI